MITVAFCLLLHSDQMLQYMDMLISSGALRIFGLILFSRSMYLEKGKTLDEYGSTNLLIGYLSKGRVFLNTETETLGLLLRN